MYQARRKEGKLIVLVNGIRLTASADVGAAGGYVLFISVLSFILWYRPIYLGFTRSEGRAMAFFFCKLHPSQIKHSYPDDRHLLLICRISLIILDIHGHRYPMYVAPIVQSSQFALISSCRVRWVDQYNRNVLPRAHCSRYIRCLLLNRMGPTISRRWNLVQKGQSLSSPLYSELMIGMGLQEWSWGYHFPSCMSISHNYADDRQRIK